MDFLWPVVAMWRPLGAYQAPSTGETVYSPGSGGHTVRRLVTDDPQRLRAEAEARLARTPPSVELDHSTAALLRDLQVHQIELEMQNEELRRSQLELEEAHVRYVDLFDFAPAGYLTLDALGHITRANLTAAALLGVEREILVGRTFADFVAPGGRAPWRLLLSQVQVSADCHALDLTLLRRDGTDFDGHLSCQQRNGSDSDSGVRIVLSDRSEARKVERADQAVARSDAKYRGLFDSLMDGFAVVAMDGVIRDCNEVYRKMLGYSADELAQTTYQDLTPEVWHAAEARIVAEQVLPRGYSDAYEKEYRRKDGTTFPVEMRTFLLKEAGRPVAMWAIVRDITARKLGEKALGAHHAQIALTSRVAALGTLVRGVAHEISNPLAAAHSDQDLALGAVRELRDRLRGSVPLDREAEIHHLDEVVEELGEAQEAGRRIERIVRDVKTFGRPDQKDARERLRLIDVVALAMRWLPATINQTATVAVENGGAPDVVVTEGQITQVLVNLVTNAAKATAEGSRGAIVIRVAPGKPGMARLDVIDHGAGIEPAVMPHIFEPFFTTSDEGWDAHRRERGRQGLDLPGGVACCAS
jgi:two-component system sensor kinase FixL